MSRGLLVEVLENPAEPLAAADYLGRRLIGVARGERGGGTAPGRRVIYHTL